MRSTRAFKILANVCRLILACTFILSGFSKVVVVTLNDIPRESRLLSVDALVKEGYVLVGIPADL